MKKLTAIFTNLAFLTSCGMDTNNVSQTSSEPLLKGYAFCQETNVDHGYVANIKVDGTTGKIALVDILEVTIENVFPVATLANCKSVQTGEISTTFCREDITDSYSINIVEGGIMAKIDATLSTGKKGRAVEMTCSYGE